jgi:hypothetical protein
MTALDDLVDELGLAWAYTDSLWLDLSDDEVTWRPSPQSSAIGWHLGHQAAVAHYTVRNLLAAEASLDPELDALMDSATPEAYRGELPERARLQRYRSAVAERVLARVDAVRTGTVGAPAQLHVVADGVVRALVNHEYQHAQWIGEVRHRDLGHPLPPRPSSPRLTSIDGYVVLAP